MRPGKVAQFSNARQHESRLFDDAAVSSQVTRVVVVDRALVSFSRNVLDVLSEILGDAHDKGLDADAFRFVLAPNREEAGRAIGDDGVVFKVQIGAFRNKDLSKYFENNENFGGETDADGVQKITLGKFRDYWESDTFKKYLREMGVNDAWIVPYKDGERVAMKDVLEGVVQ